MAAYLHRKSPYLLDRLGANQPVAAWSTRRLSRNWLGPCLTAWNNSTTQDIGFARGVAGGEWIDQNAVAAYANGANASVSRWYNQVGTSALDCLAQTFVLAPKLYVNGTAKMNMNGQNMPGIYATTQGEYFYTSSVPLPAGSKTFTYMLVVCLTNTSNCRMICQGTTSNVTNQLAGLMALPYLLYLSCENDDCTYGNLMAQDSTVRALGVTALNPGSIAISNGKTQNNGSTPTTALNVSNAAFNLFRKTTGAENVVNGWIAEALIWAGGINEAVMRFVNDDQMRAFRIV